MDFGCLHVRKGDVYPGTVTRGCQCQDTYHPALLGEKKQLSSDGYNFLMKICYNDGIILMNEYLIQL